MIRLVLPTLKYYKSHFSGLRGFVVGNNLKEEKFKEIEKINPKEYIRMSRETVTKNGSVPQITYWLVDDKNYLGMVTIRPKLNKDLKIEHGNIGYSIVPKYRGKGYGNLALKLGLRKLKKAGIHKILVTCDKSNGISQKVIERNGGKFFKEIVSPTTHVPIFQYHILNS